MKYPQAAFRRTRLLSPLSPLSKKAAAVIHRPHLPTRHSLPPHANTSSSSSSLLSSKLGFRSLRLGLSAPRDLSFPMADSITASAILHEPLRLSHSKIAGSARRRVQFEFTGKNLVFLTNPNSRSTVIRAVAEELTREAYLPRDVPYAVGGGLASPMRLWPPSNKADNPALHNPLLRQERMGCGWLSVILELEGVIVEDDPALERQAWLVLSQEEGKSPPPAFVLRRIEGMKNEQAIAEVLCWSRDPTELRRLAARKEEVHRALGGGMYRLRPGSEEFMSTLMKQKIPIAIVSTRPRKNLEEAMEAVGMQGSFDAVVTAEDVHRGKPDPEMFVYAAQLLNFIPERCIVFGNSNSTVEAAHDTHMKCVAVASKQPGYELGAADLVVRRLTELSFVDLKNLVAVESPEVGSEEPEVELEPEVEPSRSTSVTARDVFW